MSELETILGWKSAERLWGVRRCGPYLADSSVSSESSHVALYSLSNHTVWPPREPLAARGTRRNPAPKEGFVNGLRLIHANAQWLSEYVAPESVDCCVTSPPYFGLRSYKGVDPAIDPGAQDTVEGYIGMLVGVFREVWEALKPTGVLWVNVGDSMYSGSGARPCSTNPKPGDLLGIPWRLALALQQDGWTLRMDCIWAKDAPMPESVAVWRWERCRAKIQPRGKAEPDSSQTWAAETGQSMRAGGIPVAPAQWQPCSGCPKCQENDGLVLRRGSWRATKAHEYLFMFTKGMGYFAEQESVKEAAMPEHFSRYLYAFSEDSAGESRPDGARNTPGRKALSGFRNPRSVRSFSRKGDGKRYKHHASFPVSLPEFCIRASTPSAGVCSECGAPWAPVTGEVIYNHRSTCTCRAEAVPAAVLDPLMGTGSTLVAALRLGRRAIGVDASEEYVRMAQERCQGIPFDYT